MFIAALDNHRRIADPDRAAILSPQAVFRLKGLLPDADRFGFDDRGVVVRMNEFHPPLGTLEPLIRRVTKDGLDLRAYVIPASVHPGLRDVTDRGHPFDNHPVFDFR